MFWTWGPQFGTFGVDKGALGVVRGGKCEGGWKILEFGEVWEYLKIQDLTVPRVWWALVWYLVHHLTWNWYAEYIGWGTGSYWKVATFQIVIQGNLNYLQKKKETRRIQILQRCILF